MKEQTEMAVTVTKADTSPADDVEIEDDETPEVEATEAEAETDGEETLDVTPVEDKVATEAPAKATDKVRQWTPTAQQAQLGGPFENIDMRLHYVQPYRTKGTPSVTQREDVKKVKVPGKPAVEEVKDAEGNITTPAVAAVPDSFREEKVTVNVVNYTYDNDNKELLGDPMPSLTAALRAQKGMAKELEKEGLAVKEFISKEYGVWYAEDPEGKKPGYRYTIMPVAAPAKPVKEKVVKEPKPKKEKVAKEPKAAKTTKAGTAAAAAENAVAASDPVDVEIEE